MRIVLMWLCAYNWRKSASILKPVWKVTMSKFGRYVKFLAAPLIVAAAIVIATSGKEPANAQDRLEDIWYVEYYNNTFLEPPIVLNELLEGPFLMTEWNWGDTPQPEVDDDLFSARFTIETVLDQNSNYAFNLAPDDGARMTINGFELFNINGFEEARALGFYDKRVLPITAGTYEIVIEYYDILGDNGVQAFWEPTTDAPSNLDENVVVPNLRPLTGSPAPSQPVAPSAPVPPPVASNTITDIVVADGRFDTLEAAVIAAGLADTLAGPGTFTVFAPTDAAFAALPDGTLEGLLADPNGALREILFYHVASGSVPSTQVVTLTEVPTLAGPTVTVTTSAAGVFLNGNVGLVQTDVQASNGIIHVIDAVLIPSVDAPAAPAAGDTGPFEFPPATPEPESDVAAVGTAAALPASATIIDESDPLRFIQSGTDEFSFALGGATNNAYAYSDNGQFTLGIYGRWNLDIAATGTYEVYVYVPARPTATRTARYRVYASGALSDVILVDQAANAGQWVSLGQYNFLTSDLAYIYLNDLTFEERGSTDVLFDSAAFAPVE